MRIKLETSEWIDDWYLIVRAEHDGRFWWEETGPNSERLMSSERLSPEACIEGTANEMLSIADAIKSRGSAIFKRCAVRVKDDIAYFCSPKNSEHDSAIPLVEADAFAEQVFKELRV